MLSRFCKCFSKGSKATKAADTPTPFKDTLVESPTQKVKVDGKPLETLAIFLDAVGISGCLVPAEAMLRVEDVEGGPIGLWNNRAFTEKVNKGDLITKVRKAGSSEAQWLAGDAKQ